MARKIDFGLSKAGLTIGSGALLKPAGFTRVPGSKRGSGRQELIELNNHVTYQEFNTWFKPYLADWNRETSKPEKPKLIGRKNGSLLHVVEEYLERSLSDGEQIYARCPSCAEMGGDKKHSNLAIKCQDGKVMLFCHANCTFLDVVDALKENVVAV